MGGAAGFVDYIVGALIRHGVTQQFDLEDALQRIMFWMLSPVGERGLPKKSLFDFDESRPYDLRVGNPLQAIFRQCLGQCHSDGGRRPDSSPSASPVSQ